MITFKPLEINNESYQLREMSFNDAIKVSIIDSSFHEQRLTKFLQCTLSDKYDPIRMPMPIRYLLLLKYLEGQKSQSVLSLNRDISEFYKIPGYVDYHQNDKGFIRQLNGADLEFIEKNATSVAEAYSIAISCQFKSSMFDDMPQLVNQNLPIDEYEQQTIERLQYIKNLSLSDFDNLSDDFNEMSTYLKSNIRYVFCKNGIAIKGGTDDAPTRFCGLIANSRFFNRLEK